MPLKKKRQTKLTPLQLKSQGMSSGINSSNKTQLKKIEKVDTSKKLEQVPLSNLYMRLDGTWIHKGLSCRLCGKLMNHPTVIDKHRYICEVLNKDIED